MDRYRSRSENPRNTVSKCPNKNEIKFLQINRCNEVLERVNGNRLKNQPYSQYHWRSYILLKRDRKTSDS